MQHRTIKPITFAIAAAVAVPGVATAAARVELRPSGELVVDTPARLMITVDGAAGTPPRFDIRGARVAFNGQANRTVVANGQLTRETVLMYTVTPQRTGALDIPAIRVGGDETEPVHATVVAQSRTASSGAAASASPTAGAASAAHVDEPTRAFVRIDAPKRTLYVGEAVPVKIRAYFRAGVAAALQGAPHLTSSAFTLDALSDKPAQHQIEIDGVPYLQATWTAVLSAAKPTTDKVTIELPVEISYRERRPAAQRRSVRDLFPDDPFGDMGFFDDDPMAGFGGAFGSSLFDDDAFAGFDSMFDVGDVRRQELTLRSTAAKTQIAELPEKGRPDAFGGAVGDFELTVEAPKTPLRAGEPATLAFRVTGTGSFDHVAVAGVPASADWKVYPGKSDVVLDKDGEGSGTKTIEQTIVPTHAGTLEIPGVAFDFFDPKRGIYRTVHTEPMHVDVAAAVGGGAADPDLASSSTRGSQMSPNRAAASHGRSTLTPLVQQSSFWMFPGVLALLTALQLGIAWNRRSAWAQQKWRERRVSRGVRREQRQLAVAERSGDSAAFFEAARRSLQLALAERWSVRPESITAADVHSRLGDDGAPICELFDHADHVKYTHHVDAPESLRSWRAVVDTQLKKWEVSR
jgi:hypothetical protein